MRLPPVIRSSIVVLIALSISCTGAPNRSDGGDARSADGTSSDGAITLCTTDHSCDDSIFCNGVERCMPSAPGADPRGCIAASAGPCQSTQRCDEALARCVTACDVEEDADHDGHRATRCGGDDCDDSDANRFPGNTEVCALNAAGDARVAAEHDEDCDPLTYANGSTRDGDHDGDGYIDSACCNVDLNGGRHCGNDCADLHDVDAVPASLGRSIPAARVHPTQAESCDGVDDDCNGEVDDGDPGGGGLCGVSVPNICRPGIHHCEMGALTCVEDFATPGFCCYGFADCNRDASDGCETQLAFDPAHCGACGTACEATRGTPICTGGTCGYSACATGLTLCGTSCVDTQSDRFNCSACGHACPAIAGGTPGCNAGVCGRDCGPSVAYCNGTCIPWDAGHCGAACTRCIAPLNGTVSCNASGACEGACPAGSTLVAGRCERDGMVRQMAPLSTSNVTSHRPTLSWALGMGVAGAHVKLCRNRALTTGCVDVDVDSGSSWRSATGLATGEWFWRLQPRTGGVTSPMTTATWQFRVSAVDAPHDSSFGSRLDVNGDGYSDLAAAILNGLQVYLGSSAGLATTPATTISARGLGYSLAPAGDVNGDGFADLVALSDAGGFHASIFYGGSTGLSTTSARDVSAPSSSADWPTVAHGGDVNGDGYADVLVAGQGDTVTPGSVFVFFGSASGIGSTPDVVLTGAPGDAFGAGIAGGGDMNGDGYADVVVGAPNYAGGAGVAYAYPGSALGPDAAGRAPFNTTYGGAFGSAISLGGEFDGDGYADVAVGAPQAYSGHGGFFTFHGSAASIVGGADANFRSFMAMTRSCEPLASAGDVNADGRSDVLIGSDVYDAADAAEIWVWWRTGSLMDNQALPVVHNAQYGGAVSILGDVNGDGYDDFAIAGHWAPNGTMTLAGQIDVYYGRSTTGMIPGGLTAFSAPNVTLRGAAGSTSLGWFVARQ